MTAFPFVPPRDAQFYLLNAHRQPLPANIAAHFIETFTQPGELVVDPFAASDAVVRVALERGRRILASEVNPLVAWATRMQATLPPAREIHAALARLGEIRKDNENLHAYIEKMYASQCAQCGGSVIVDYFVNVRDGAKNLLAEKIYACAQCGARRDAVTEGDHLRANDAAPRGLTLPLLKQRLYGDDTTNTAPLKRLLEMYTPRNLNALAAITQKLDAEFRQDNGRNVLAALFLQALDYGTSLYPAPDAVPMRTIPETFVEMNVWHLLEQAARGLSERAAALRLAANPAPVLNANAPAAWIGQGGARFLAENAPGANAALILSSPARLDPTFWELSFLWARWLLGKNAAAPLEPLLDVEHQRWGWYGGALTRVFEQTTQFTRADARVVMTFPSGSHAMIEALLLSASSQYALEDFAFRPARDAQKTTEFGALRGNYQTIWMRHDAAVTTHSADSLAPRLRQGALRGALDLMRARGEPLAYSWLHHAALVELARENVLADATAAKYREGDNAFQFLRNQMERGLKVGYESEIDHWRDETRVLWFAPETDELLSPLCERVERAVRAILRERVRIGNDDLHDALLEKFSGVLTPEIELIEICARAYADYGNDEWIWRDENRDAWLTHTRSLAEQLGAHLGYQVAQGDAPIEMLWRVEKIIPGSARGAVREERFHEDAYGLIFRARADLQALTESRAPLHGFIVIPETQVELTRERLRRDPRWLKKLSGAGWEFLRVPMLELLLRQGDGARSAFPLAWGLEPPLWSGEKQMDLFE